jgi:hypothetical protein
MDAADVAKLFDEELSRIRDARIVAALRRFQVPIRCEQRRWDYGSKGQTYPCWVVADDCDSATSFVYCEFGFGPRQPWGLLNMADSPNPQSMGGDWGWFATLEAAFRDSYAWADIESLDDKSP